MTDLHPVAVDGQIGDDDGQATAGTVLTRTLQRAVMLKLGHSRTPRNTG